MSASPDGLIFLALAQDLTWQGSMGGWMDGWIDEWMDGS